VSAAVEMHPFWVSWWSLHQFGSFELHSPWWISGERDDGAVSVCAAVRAVSEAAAMDIVSACYDTRPDSIEFRFVEQREGIWSPFTDRFPRAEWMQW